MFLQEDRIIIFGIYGEDRSKSFAKFCEAFYLVGCPAFPLYKKQFYSYSVIIISYIVRKWHILIKALFVLLYNFKADWSL